MPAFKRFGPGDQVDNVLILEPSWDLASGTAGWRGSPEGSASVSLYGGYNRQPGGVVQSYQFQRTIQGTDSFGKLTRSEPITASVNFVWMTDEDLNLAQRTSTRWGHEHWKTVMRLYDYYHRRDPDYTTASYDFYSLYFQKSSTNVVVLSGNLAQLTGSFTVESWVKPLLTASSANDFTIQSRNNVFWFGITGSSGMLAFSSSYGIVTASAGPRYGTWSHAAVTYDSTTYSGTFYLNLQRVGTFTMTPLTASATTTLHSFGNRIAGYGSSAEGPWSVGSSGRSLHGFLGESRVWRSARSYSQLSSSYNHRLTDPTDLGAAQVVLWMNEGPLGIVGGFSQGSGVLDQAQLATGSSLPYGNLRGFDDRLGPVWHPSDNTSFFPTKQLVTGSVARMLAVSVPAGMYGRRIVPNTVRLTCNVYDDSSHGLVRTLIDDGRGGLFLSGTAHKNVPLDYPASPNETARVFGSTMDAAWALEDTTGSLVPTFYPSWVSSPNLDYSAGNPVYRVRGAKVEGTDFAVRLSGSTSFQTNNCWGVTSGSDLVVIWSARVSPYNGFQDFIQKGNGGRGWNVWFGSSGVYLLLTDGTVSNLVTTSGTIVNEPHVGIVAYNRATSKAQVAVKGVFSGQTYSSGQVNISLTGSFESTQPFSVGAFQYFGLTNPNLELSQFYIATGSNAAAGVMANLTGALNSLAAIVASRSSQDSTSSVTWNKVGNVFYDEGLVVIKDPALLDYAASWPGLSSKQADGLLQLSFRGESRIPVKTLMCRIDRGDLNASLNPTFYDVEEDGERIPRHPSGSIYVSTVGIYNSDRELVGVARLAEPLRVRPRDRMNVKLRMDF